MGDIVQTVLDALVSSGLTVPGCAVEEATAQALRVIGCTAADPAAELQLRLGLWLIETPHPPNVRAAVAALVSHHQVESRGLAVLPS